MLPIEKRSFITHHALSLADNLEEEFGTWLAKQKESDVTERKAVTQKLQTELAALKQESDAKYEAEKKKVAAEFVCYFIGSCEGVLLLCLSD